MYLESHLFRHPKSGYIPQCPILGPLIFLININDIIEDIRSCIRPFTGDISLYSIVDTQQAADALKADIAKIHLYKLQNG